MHEDEGVAFQRILHLVSAAADFAGGDSVFFRDPAGITIGRKDRNQGTVLPDCQKEIAVRLLIEE